MPLLDIATAKPSFQRHIFLPRTQTLLHNKVLFGNEKRLSSGWNVSQVPKKERNFSLGQVDTQWRVLVLRAVATLEPKYLGQSNSGKDGQHIEQHSVDSKNTLEKEHQYLGDSEAVDEKEKLRRMRISKANSGKTPWNKGRKHSAETLRRIKERTRIAMQDPKVKMKLVNLGHAQSEETRIKIGVGVRTRWKRRHEKLMAREMCYFEWQNLIAEASRRGFDKEEQLQWDSYKILDEEFEREWLESVKQRKQMPRLKGNKRAPKSLEQRRKIAEAISAKWADPAYRDRVCSALSKYHGSTVAAERRPRRRPSGEIQRQPRTPRLPKKKAKDADNKSRKIVKGSENHRTTLRRSIVPLYKDPLASSKLEMIKNIRAERAAAETKKTQAIKQAKLLIAEAEKAAKALEAAALRSPLAQASLTETRNLIAEAIQLIQSIEIMQIDSHENGRSPTDSGEINGTRSMELNEGDIEDFDFGAFNFKELVTGENVDPATNSCFNDLLNNKEEFRIPGINGHHLPLSEMGSMIKQTSIAEQLSHLEPNGNSRHDKELLPIGTQFQFGKEKTIPNSIIVSKKWIRGRLVEVVEGDVVNVQ